MPEAGNPVETRHGGIRSEDAEGSAPETGTEKTPLSLNEAIRDVVALAQGEIRRNGVNLIAAVGKRVALLGTALARACVRERNAERKEGLMSPESSEDEKLLTKGEVAQLCRVDVRTVDRWLTAGKVPCRRTPSGRVLFRKHDVLTVVARARRPRKRDR